MKLTPHFISGYVYLTENRMPKLGEHYTDGLNVFMRSMPEDSPYESDRAIVVDNDPEGLSNLTDSDAEHCKGKESVEIETWVEIPSGKIVPKLEDSKVIVKREEVKDENYWKTRCELAEKFIDESPCDPDITPAQIVAWDNYQTFLKSNH